MANATVSAATIDPREAEHFGRLAADWWDPKGSSAMLHRLNPARLKYIRRMIDAEWDVAPTAFEPLRGKTALDMGCGAGLLAEPLARLGAAVTGVDAAPENVGAARAHADKSRLSVDYVVGDVEAVRGRRFDLVTSMEVVEHVTDPQAFVEGLADLVEPGGLLILSTPNRTALSRALMITLAEGVGAIPRGTHQWDKFLTPEELSALVEGAGLEVIDLTGLTFSPARGFALGPDLRLNYLLTARKA